MTHALDSASDTLQHHAGEVVTHSGGRAAVVVNASKFVTPAALARFRSEVSAALESRGWLPPLWLPTTAETRGVAEARFARAAGVEVVLVAGGDGTVRAVAQELVGSSVALGLLPMGTGNLLARNLGIPLGDVRAAVAIATGRGARAIDVGWLEMDPTADGRPKEHAFLVMAGAGFDAAVMAGAGPRLKRRLGALAYLVSGGRALQRAMVDATVSGDADAIVTGPSRGFVVGNFGRLSGGFALMPDADPADGLLEGVVLRPRGMLDWARLALSVATGGGASPFMPRLRGRTIDYDADTPQQVEVDGDVIGEATRVRTRIQRAALLVRV